MSNIEAQHQRKAEPRPHALSYRCPHTACRNIFFDVAKIGGKTLRHNLVSRSIEPCNIITRILTPGCGVFTTTTHEPKLGTKYGLPYAAPIEPVRPASSKAPPFILMIVGLAGAIGRKNPDRAPQVPPPNDAFRPRSPCAAFPAKKRLLLTRSNSSSLIPCPSLYIGTVVSEVQG